MIQCFNCEEVLFDDANFCPKCGLSRNDGAVHNKTDGYVLVALCIATMLGSLFTICRALIYEIFASIISEGYYRGWIYILTALGTLGGAIMMLMKKKTGLYIYTLFQIIYVLTVFIALFDHSNGRLDPDSIEFVISLIFLIPSFLFLILYWLGFIRKQLN